MKILDQDKYKYGWLSPKGTFYEQPHNHESLAFDLVHRYFGKGKPLYKVLNGKYSAGDFLRDRYWVLIHNPNGRRISIEIERQLTKKQKEFLYDYYIGYGMKQEAIGLWKE